MRQPCLFTESLLITVSFYNLFLFTFPFCLREMTKVLIESLKPSQLKCRLLLIMGAEIIIAERLGLTCLKFPSAIFCILVKSVRFGKSSFAYLPALTGEFEHRPV